MSGVFHNIDPPPPHRPASVYPPPPSVRGEDTVAGWRGGRGGQYFGRRQTQLCTLHTVCKNFVPPPRPHPPMLCYLRRGATASTFPMRTAIWQMPMVRARARTGSLRDDTTAIGSRNGIIPSCHQQGEGSRVKGSRIRVH
jgi:hypothetical protein